MTTELTDRLCQASLQLDSVIEDTIKDCLAASIPLNELRMVSYTDRPHYSELWWRDRLIRSFSIKFVTHATTSAR